MNVLEAKNVSIAFDEKVILENINLSIAQQESIVFIGPSGAGKTVLLKVLAGIVEPAKGDVYIEGENWRDLESKEKHDLARKLGMLFQQGALFDTMTALENIEFPLREHEHLSEEELEQKALELLDKVNLLDSKNKMPGQLSGGMQRRLGIARALALNPKILFSDDPVAGQDPMQSDQMLQLISDFKQQNETTLIMVTSSMRAAFRMADRIFMLIDGEMIETGSPEETLKHADARVQQFIHGDLEGPIKSL